jgi:hypothetical protein
MVDQGDNKIVEEFPKPPKYYECFRADEKIIHQLQLDAPPPIPQNERDVYDVIYDGVLSRSTLLSMGKIPIKDDLDNYDYRAGIKRYVHNFKLFRPLFIFCSALDLVVLNSLNILSLSTVSDNEILLQAETVRGSLTQLYTELAKYRKREAQMEVYHQLKAQLQRARELERTLEE